MTFPLESGEPVVVRELYSRSSHGRPASVLVWFVAFQQFGVVRTCSGELAVVIALELAAPAACAADVSSPVVEDEFAATEALARVWRIEIRAFCVACFTAGSLNGSASDQLENRAVASVAVFGSDAMAAIIGAALVGSEL